MQHERHGCYQDEEIPLNKAKQLWKVFYRLERIARREHLKSVPDLMLWGTSCVLIQENGEAKHIPIEKVKKEDLDS